MNKREMVGKFGESVGRYMKNLHVKGDKVHSYTTHVATIDRPNRKLYVHGKWSPTTSKHVNYIAKMHGLTKIDKPHKKDSHMASVGKYMTK